MIRFLVTLRSSATLAAMLLTVATASAATSFSNSLTGFTGDSTVPATQAAVAAAGFNFAEFGDANTKVSFSAGGAQFGPVLGTTPEDGNIQRNYMRTNDSDYSAVSFVLEITIATTQDIDLQDAYVGLGSGDISTSFRLPDVDTDAASVMYWGENEPDNPTLEIGRTNDQSSNFLSVPAPGFGTGTHRLRMTHDWFRKVAEFSLDLDYAGGPFNADVTASISTMPLYLTTTGFPVDPGRIFFGGDQTTTFRDFSVAVNSSPHVFGDLSGDSSITNADWTVLRTNLYSEPAGSAESMYLKGDLNGDFRINQEDFILFKTLYDLHNGSGAFLQMLAGVPEPTSLALLLSTALSMVPVRRRRVARP